MLTIIPIVGIAMLITGWMVIDNATRTSHVAVYRYSEGILGAYITQDLSSRADILRKNRLENVSSFVDRYQQEALAAADQLNLIWPGHLFVVDDRWNVIYCSSKEMPDRLPEAWEGIYRELKHGKQTLKGHVPGHERLSFVGRYFEPWNWAVFIVIKGDFLHERERFIWLTVAVAGILTSFLIVVSLGVSLHKLVLAPVRYLREATRQIAEEKGAVVIPVADGDEFGELSRDIEEMSRKIDQSRKDLRQAFEELKTLDEMKSILIANVSHELRTPLTSILGFSKIGMRKLEKLVCKARATGCDAQVTSLEPALRDALNAIMGQGEYMAGMVDNIIVLMSLMSEETVIEKLPLDIVSLVEKVCGSYRDKIESKGLELVVASPQNDIEVAGDSKMIRLVLGHYISNALTFTDAGSIAVSVSVEDNEAVVEVRDTGRGVPNEEIEKIFNRFYQVGDVMIEKPKGLGVGLPICRKVIHLHGGRVWAESVLGKGSTFSFSLPLVEGPE